MLKAVSGPIYAHSFSEKYLSTLSDTFTFSDSLLEDKRDFCFIENLDIAPFLSSIDCVILYKWNRDYPFDMTFDVDTYYSKAVEYAGHVVDDPAQTTYHLDPNLMDIYDVEKPTGPEHIFIMSMDRTGKSEATLCNRLPNPEASK